MIHLGGRPTIESIFNLENRTDFPFVSFLRSASSQFYTNSINSILLNDPIGSFLPPRLI
jgi:hypothetical protein